MRYTLGERLTSAKFIPIFHGGISVDPYLTGLQVSVVHCQLSYVPNLFPPQAFIRKAGF